MSDLQRSAKTEGTSRPCGLIRDEGQEQRILELLKGGEWVSARDLSAVSLQYCARLHSIRKKLAEEGVFVVENRLVIDEGRRRGWYRLKRIRPEEPQSVLFPAEPLSYADPEEGARR